MGSVRLDQQWALSNWSPCGLSPTGLAVDPLWTHSDWMRSDRTRSALAPTELSLYSLRLGSLRTRFGVAVDPLWTHCGIALESLRGFDQSPVPNIVTNSHARPRSTTSTEDFFTPNLECGSVLKLRASQEGIYCG